MNRLNEEQGQTIIEAAFAFLLLLLIVFCIIEGGRLLYTYHYLSYAARQGSRYAMVRGAACNNSSGMPNCPLSVPDAGEVQSYVRTTTFMGIDASQVNVTVNWGPSPSESSCSTANCNNPGDEVIVNVTYAFGTILPVPGAGSFSLHSISQRIIAQ
jgi:hypothetical protein